jgi:hypothetical protein
MNAGAAGRPGVLQLVESFREGGSERQAAQLVRLLGGGGRYRLHVACLNADGACRAGVDRLGLGRIEHYPLTSFRDVNFVVQLSRFARYLRRHAISVLHTHDFYTNVFGMAAGALAGVPVRVASRRETAGTRTAAQKRVERLAYRLAHAVVANAGAVRDALVAEGVPARKVVTVYNGLDQGRVASDATREEALAHIREVVEMIVGRLVEEGASVPVVPADQEPATGERIVVTVRAPLEDAPQPA